MKTLPFGVRNASLKLQHIPLAFTDIPNSPALHLKGFFHFQMAQVPACATVMPLQT